MANSDSMTHPTHAHGGRVLFWYLRLYFAMSFTAIATGTLWYQFINKLVPLQITFYGVRPSFDDRYAIWAMAAIIVVGPALLLSTAALHKSIGKNEIELSRGVRQWVSFIFLFYVVAVAIGDMVTVFRYLLSGDYSLRFFLKSLTILTLSLWIFAYVWQSLKSIDGLASSSLPRLMGFVTGAVLLVSLINGFFLIDSPMHARAKRFDQQRTFDLREIENGINNYYRTNNVLPETLEVLLDAQMVMPRATTDPGSGALYGYRILSEDQYEICAAFTTSDQEEDKYYSPRAPTGQYYMHDGERTCFERRVNDPNRGLPPR